VALTDVGRDIGPRAMTTGSALLRRLVITCPITGLTTDTGIALSELPAVVTRAQLLVDCLECGQDHPWHIGDAMLEH
jgi:hypothetical protein